MSTKGKRAIHQYPEKALQDALNAIREDELSVSFASKLFGVPRATIQDRFHGRIAEGPRKMGPSSYLSTEEETILEKWCEDLAKCGFSIKINELQTTVQKIVKADKRATPFVNGRPGRSWINCFLKRHPKLALREVEGITKGW